MIKLISSKVACILCKEDDDETLELFEYGIYIVLSAILHTATVILLGLLLNMLVESIIFYCSFIAIRKFAGGYHAKTATRCYLFSLLISIIILFLIKLFCFSNIYLLMLLAAIGILCVILITHIAPLDTDNNPLNVKEKILYGKMSSVISIILLCISITAIILNCINIGVSIIFGIFMSTIVLLARYAQDLYNKH